MHRAGALVTLGLAACGFHRTATADLDAEAGRDAPAQADAAAADALPFPDGGNPAEPCVMRWKDHSIRFDPPTPVTAFATIGVAERDPFLGPKGILYASKPTVGDLDIYESHPDTTGHYGTPTRVDALSGIGVGDEKLALATGANVVVLARAEAATADTAAPGYGGDVDLWEADVTVDATTGELTTGPFSTAHFAGLNGTGGDHDPWITPDGKHLYWAPAVAGGGVQVISTASRGGTNQAFTNPTQLALGEAPTTSLGDPWLADDQKLIVYTATAAGGTGQIRYALAGAGATWQPSQDVPDINDPTRADGDPIVSKDGCTIYFGSERAGSWDVYAATVHDPPP